MDTQLLAAIFQKIVDGFSAISLVYLFGSRVDGQVGPMSDYDFAILVDRHRIEPHLQAQVMHLLRVQLTPAHVDVVLLNHAVIELAYAIIKLRATFV